MDSNLTDNDILRAIWDSCDSPQDGQCATEEALGLVMAKIDRKRRRRRGFFATVSCISLCLAVLAGFGLYTVTRDDGAVRMVQCYVPNGQMKTILLSDGTEVTLNSGTLLSYPESFRGNSRNVYIVGEGTFKVAHDKKHPFIVSSQDFDVKVLGTVFNLSSYAEASSSSVVLVEGSVAIRQGSQETLLAVNQKAEYSRDGGRLRISGVNVSDYLNWNKGGITLMQADISEIMRILENRYDTDVFCNLSPHYKDACITAKFDGAVPVEEFLGVLEKLIPGMRYKVEGRNIWLY